MYEIADITRRGGMFIKVPDGTGSKWMHLDKYNYIKAVGNDCSWIESNAVSMLHIDGDYRNCEACNLVPFKGGKKRIRFQEMLDNTETESAKQFVVSIVELINEIDRRSHKSYSQMEAQIKESFRYRHDPYRKAWLAAYKARKRSDPEYVLRERKNRLDAYHKRVKEDPEYNKKRYAKRIKED